jgi:type IV pilus assembly protein PilV
MTHTARPTDRGTTLIEAMVALTILLIGLLGMMQLQVLGITSNAGARSHSQALQLAHELASALEQLDAKDALIELPNNLHFTGATPPAGFGSVLSAPNTLRPSTAFTEFADSMVGSLRGVTTNAAIVSTYGKDPTADLPRFQRRWQVWQMDTASETGGVKAIAVSVTYREQRLPGLREVVLLTQVSNRGLASAFAAAYR